MSSVLFIEPILFGPDPGINDNAFIASAQVEETRALEDQALAQKLLQDLRKRVQAKNIDARILRLIDEPCSHSLYGSKGDAIFPNNSISFHNFTNENGIIERRVVILYPMSQYRRNELPNVQLIEKLYAAFKQKRIHLLDIRHFETENRCLEGTGALNFSYNGRYVYMSRSHRTDDAILDLICNENNLNIPKEHRFMFSSATPRQGTGEDIIYHTNVMGWCGKRICAWAVELMRFDSEDAQNAFYRHLISEYDCILKLSTREISKFAGNAFELAGHTSEGKEVRFLCISQTALESLSPRNRDLLERWYGADNVLGFQSEVLERRSGGSVRCTMAASFTVGNVSPAINQASILEYIGISDCSE